VHRDYHARNLMPQSDTSLAVIDFQDAVLGPVTYDLVSLLKDCYWRLPRANVLALVEGYRKASGIQASEVQFLRWFDLIGFQRHLKCAGIFSRLNLRDGKPGYLADIPLVMDYLIEVAELYGELSAFGAWLKDDIQPVMQRQLS
jgi:aminoglycoside/choline kinase family phosphotransferase